MKNFFLLLFIVFAIVSCKNEQKPTATPATDAIEAVIPNPTDAPMTVNIPVSSDGNVHHYVCADKCEGGFSDNGGTCPVCGKTLVHNQAFHDQQQAAPQMQVDQNSPNIQQVTPPQTQDVSVPAGADGVVHHYVCTRGCVGGNSTTAGNCPVCGNALSHNQAFHNM